MPEENGQVVASQAVVVIGAEFGQVDQAIDRIAVLEKAVGGLSLTANVRLGAPKPEELRAQLQAGLAEAVKTPLSVPIRPVLAADFARDIQVQLSSRTFDISVRPVVGGNIATANGAVAPVANPGGVVTSFVPTPSTQQHQSPAMLPSRPAPLPVPPLMEGTNAALRQEEIRSGARGMGVMGTAVAQHVAATGATPAQAARALFEDNEMRRVAMDEYRRNRMDLQAMRAAHRSIPAGVEASDFEAVRRAAEDERLAKETAAAATARARAVANGTARVQVGDYRPTLNALAGGAGMRPMTVVEQSIMRGRSSGYAALPTPLRPASLGSDVEELAALRRQMEVAAVYGRQVPEDFRSNTEASMSGAFSSVPWSPTNRAQVLRNGMLLGPRQVASRLFNGASEAEMAAAEEQSMRFQQRARRNYFAGQTLMYQTALPAVVVGGGLMLNEREFDSSFGRIAALTDTPKRNIPGLRQAVIDMAMNRGRIGRHNLFESPEDLAGAYYEAASVGFPGLGGLKVSEASAEGASAGMGRIKDIERVATQLINAYGGKPRDAHGFVEKMLMGAIIGQGEASDYVGALPNVISTASSTGVNIDQVMASLAMMSRVGIKPEVGATSLNQLLMHIKAPTPQGIEMMGKMNWTPQSMLQDVREKGLMWVSQQVIERSGGNDQIMEGLLGNVRGFKALISTAGVQGDAYKSAVRSMQSSNGQLEKSLESMGDTFDTQWKRILNTIRGTGLEITERRMPAIVKSVEGLADNLPNITGKIGDAWATTGSVGPTAALTVGGGLLAAGPLLRAMAVVDDLRSVMVKYPQLKGRLGRGAMMTAPTAGIWAAREMGYGLPDEMAVGGIPVNDILAYGSIGLQGAGLLGMLRNKGIESGDRMFSSVGTGARSLRSTYGAYAEAMAAERALAAAGGRAAPGLMSNALGFLPWMVRGGAPGATLAAGEGAAAAGAATLGGTAGGIALPVLAVAALASGATYYQEWQREMADREGQRKQVQGGRQVIGRIFEKTDDLLAYSPQAQNRLGSIALDFKAAGDDAERLQDVLREIETFKLDISKKNISLDPGVAKLLMQDLQKAADETKLHIQVVLDKPENAWEGFKRDWRNSVGDAYDWGNDLGGRLPQTPQQRFVESPYPARVTMPRDERGRTPREAALGASGMGPDEEIMGHRNRFVTEQDIMGYRNRPGAPAGAAPAGGFIAPVSPAELALESALSIKIGNGADLGKWVEKGATQAQIKALNAIIGSQPEHGPLQSAIGEQLSRAIVDRNQRIANAAQNQGAAGGGAHTEDELGAMKAAQKELDGQADGVQKLSGAYRGLEGAMDGIMGRIREQSEHTERMRMINDVYKRGLDGVTSSYKEQAIAVAGLLDRVKELSGFNNGIRGYVGGVQDSVSAVGGNIAGGTPHINRISGLIDYQGRALGLSDAGLRLGGNVATGAHNQALSLEQRINDLRAQATAAGSDYNEAKKNGFAVGSASLDALRRAIIGKESGGSYRVVNPDSGAIGYGQVMPANVPGWTQAALGHSMTPAQFRGNPEAQVATINHRMGLYLQEELAKTGGDRELAIRRVASRWYSGDADNLNSTKSQGKYPSIKAYTLDVLDRYGKEAAAARPVDPSSLPSVPELPALASNRVATRASYQVGREQIPVTGDRWTRMYVLDKLQSSGHLTSRERDLAIKEFGQSYVDALTVPYDKVGSLDLDKFRSYKEDRGLGIPFGLKGAEARYLVYKLKTGGFISPEEKDSLTKVLGSNAVESLIRKSKGGLAAVDVDDLSGFGFKVPDAAGRGGSPRLGWPGQSTRPAAASARSHSTHKSALDRRLDSILRDEVSGHRNRPVAAEHSSPRPASHAVVAAQAHETQRARHEAQVHRPSSGNVATWPRLPQPALVVSKPVYAAEKDAQNAPGAANRFGGIDDQIYTRTDTLQDVFGARIRPMPWNQNEFALQQLLERGTFQEQLAAIIRVSQYGDPAKTGYKFTDRERAALSSMESLSAAEVRKTLSDKKNSALVGRAVGALRNLAQYGDREVSAGRGAIEFQMAMPQDKLNLYRTYHPGDELGAYRTELESQDNGMRYSGPGGAARLGVLLRNRRTQMLAEDITGRSLTSQAVYATNSGYASGLNYALSDPNWNDEELSVRSHLAQKRAELEQHYERRWGPTLRARQNVDNDIMLEERRVRGQQQFSRTVQGLSIEREGIDSIEDLNKWKTYVGSGLRPYEADDQVALERDRVGLFRAGLNPDLAFMAQARRRLEAEKSNIVRYMEQAKQMNRSLASVGDGAGLVGRVMEMRDPEATRGLTPGQVDSMVSGQSMLYLANQKERAARESFMGTWGRMGIRNDMDRAQAEMDYFSQSHDARLGRMMNNGMSGSDALRTLDAERQALRLQLETARKVVPGQELQRQNRSGEADRMKWDEEYRATAAVTVKQKESLYILQQKNDLRTRGIDLDKRTGDETAEELKVRKEMTAEIEKQAKARVDAEKRQELQDIRRQSFDAMKGVTLRATQNLFNPDEATKEQQRLGLRNEDYRWSQLSMDLLDRGYSTDSKEYKAAQKRHKELQGEMREGGGLKGWFGEVVDGWGGVARNEAAQVANNALWGVIGGGVGRAIGLNVNGAGFPTGPTMGGSAQQVISSIGGFAGPLGGLFSALGGGAGGGTMQVSSLTINAGSVNVNGGGSGIAGLMLGGQSSSSQILDAVGYGIQLRSHR